MKFMHKISFLITVLCAGVFSSTKASDSLTANKLVNADECCDSSCHLFTTTYPGQRYLHHLDQFRMWLCSNGKQCSEIDSAVIQRYNLFRDTSHHNLPTNGYQLYGNNNAAIEIIAYISMTCPLCKRLYNELLDSLSTHQSGKNVAVTAIPFTNNEADRLYSASFKWGKQVELLRALHPVKERVTPELVLSIADCLGINKNELLNHAHSKEIIALTTRNRDIGIAAGVKVTPTFFINGVKYSSYKDIRWILDYIEVLMAAQ
jgi:hypothetical protein